MSVGKYILDANGDPVEEPDLITWATWLETADRILAREEVGDAVVSTVFLGLDLNLTGKGPPLTFETMVFGGRRDRFQMRYETRAEALTGHAMTVEMVRELQKGRPYEH